MHPNTVRLSRGHCPFLSWNSRSTALKESDKTKKPWVVCWFFGRFVQFELRCSGKQKGKTPPDIRKGNWEGRKSDAQKMSFPFLSAFNFLRVFTLQHRRKFWWLGRKQQRKNQVPLPAWQGRVRERTGLLLHSMQHGGKTLFSWLREW